MNTGRFRLETGAEGEPTVLALDGEHDLVTAPELRRRLDRLIAAGGPFVVDLSATTFVDSSILGVLLNGRRRAADAGVALAVSQADGAVAVSRVLQVTGLRAELPVHDSVEEALSAAAGAGR